MKLLEDKIKEYGIVKSDRVLDVSAFLNKQVDAKLMEQLGKDFANHYKDYDFDVFVTVESSGIAPAVFASLYANKPLVIIKKEDVLKDDEVYAQQPSYSFTKNHDYFLTVQKEFVENKKVVLIDDFLAQGSVAINVHKMLESVNAPLVSIGICISKNFQDGYKRLRSKGFDLYLQSEIKHLDPQTKTIVFEETI